MALIGEAPLINNFAPSASPDLAAAKRLVLLSVDPKTSREKAMPCTLFRHSRESGNGGFTFEVQQVAGE